MVLWSDEIHWATGPKYVKKVKRRPGKEERFKPSNIQYNKDARRDPEKQEYFYIFYVIRYNFAWAIKYDVGNLNGKINTKTYLKILP